MSNALHQFWAFFTTLFTAAEKGAKTIENLTTVSEEMSATYLDQTRADRKLALIKQEKALAKALPNIEPVEAVTSEPTSTKATSRPAVKPKK